MGPKKRPAAAVCRRPASALPASKRPAKSEGREAHVERQLKDFPEPNAWSEIVPQVRLHRPLKVTMPCVGIDGCGFALDALGTEYQAVNIYDLEGRYEQHLRSHLGPDCVLHLGSEAGDLTKHLYSRGSPCDILVSGPPCPPWAGQGSHAGAADVRAEVFVAVLKYCIRAGRLNALHAVVLENVKGILQKTSSGSGPSFMDSVLQEVRKALPDFDWQLAVLKAQDYKLGQQRTRIFLRGLRRVFGEVPDPLAPFGSTPLTAFLNPLLPGVNRSQLTKHMAVNLKDAERELLEKWDQGQLAETDVVCFPLDRGSNKAYVRQYTTNLAPTLTTSNKYLFVVSVGCLRKPEAERRFFRFLDSTERLTLQGFKKSVLSTSSEALRIKASGNAYPVPLLAAVLAPLLQQLAHPSARSHLDGRPQGNVQDADSAASRFEEAMERLATQPSSSGPPAAASQRRGLDPWMSDSDSS